MTNSADPDQLAYLEICTVCKGRAYLGSAGQGLSSTQSAKLFIG